MKLYNGLFLFCDENKYVFCHNVRGIELSGAFDAFFNLWCVELSQDHSIRDECAIYADCKKINYPTGNYFFPINASNSLTVNQCEEFDLDCFCEFL